MKDSSVPSRSTLQASTFERAKEAAAHLLATTARPDVGIVLGSGLGALTERLSDSHAVAYGDIPHMPGSTVLGHQGRLVTGKLGGTSVACLSGRAHLYEGHTVENVVFGVRLLAALGARAVILTNAAGGIAPSCTPGTLMVIDDQLNLTGQNPLIGPNDEKAGPRFVDMTMAFDVALRQRLHAVAKDQGIGLASGVYAGLLGPTYETPGEIRMLEVLGASAVGMSTVLEVIALRHLGTPVVGISCITNHAAGKGDSPLSHDEVAEVAGRAGKQFCNLIEGFCATWPATA